ncbi:MAG TPA: hypothetical protein VII44_06730, partial [Puia sp.]
NNMPKNNKAPDFFIRCKILNKKTYLITPVKTYTMPPRVAPLNWGELNAMENKVLLEELEITHEGPEIIT